MKIYWARPNEENIEGGLKGHIYPFVQTIEEKFRGSTQNIGNATQKEVLLAKYIGHLFINIYKVQHRKLKNLT